MNSERSIFMTTLTKDMKWQENKSKQSFFHTSFTSTKMLTTSVSLVQNPFPTDLPLLNFESSMTQFANSCLTENYSLISSHIKQGRPQGKFNSPGSNILTTFTFSLWKKVTNLDFSPIPSLSPLIYSLSYQKKAYRHNMFALSRQLEENQLYLAELLFLPTAIDLLLGKR